MFKYWLRREMYYVLFTTGNVSMKYYVRTNYKNIYV
jgi:hypothetical protein